MSRIESVSEKPQPQPSDAWPTRLKEPSKSMRTTKLVGRFSWMFVKGPLNISLQMGSNGLKAAVIASKPVLIGTEKGCA